ncbi:hypothetical protein [Streptomyces longispororuber]|uniref:hypothetical protein n=1 Tax=Streptomyces longispororuber TaxID=68230 RepID=UPI00210D892C|nr:hypothetical protein [Streptomyces longispororuber]MCQ4210990.1 hypothetical protein [Streptomyces longispororuber]
MAWDEWEQAKASAADRQSTHMQLNTVDGGGLDGSSAALPGKTGDLKVSDRDLAKIGGEAGELYQLLWDKARVADASSTKAAADLSGQGFSVGSGLQHVANRWSEQLNSLMDACAHISNHMQTTKKVHAGDEHYIQRQMSSIDTLDQGFDERVGEEGRRNPAYYGKPSDKKDS